MVAVAALMLAVKGADPLMQAHSWVLAGCMGVATFVAIGRLNFASAGSTETAPNVYMDGVVRLGCIATLFWGIAGISRMKMTISYPPRGAY